MLISKNLTTFSHQSEDDICKITSGKKWLISNKKMVAPTFQKPQETQDSCSNDSFWNSTDWNFCKLNWIWSSSLQTDRLELPIRRGLAWPGKDVIFIREDFFFILGQFLRVFKFLNPKDPPDDEDRWGTAGKAWWSEINISTYYYSVIKQLWYVKVAEDLKHLCFFL